MRMMLAALEWNSTERQPILDEDGQQKYKVVYSKRRKLWVKKACYKQKKSDYLCNLLSRILEVNRKGLALPSITKPDLPSNVAKTPKPAPSEIGHISRFYCNA